MTSQTATPTWNSYYGEGVDTSVLHEQAQTKMTDRRDPVSTLIHHHAHARDCAGAQHTLYNHVTGKSGPFAIPTATEDLIGDALEKDQPAVKALLDSDPKEPYATIDLETGKPYGEE